MATRSRRWTNGSRSVCGVGSRRGWRRIPLRASRSASRSRPFAPRGSSACRTFFTRSRSAGAELRGAAAPTQEALYRDLDLDLSWSEGELPERERTKHVHRLHPYLGKFIPQLVEVLLGRYFAPGQHVLDPFAGSGTTLVQALESGLDATGVDVAAFNCLLVDVKTRPYNLFTLEHELRDACGRLDRFEGTRPPKGTSAYVRRWFAPQAAAELLAFRDMIPAAEHGDVMRVVLARAARSARQTAHFDLDFPKTPQTEPY